MRVTDKEIEQALDQLSQAMGNDKSAREYEKLWDKARYDGKPQYIDGVVMSGHIFEKSITEMRKMEMKAERIPPGMDLVKQETMKKYQFIPPCEMRGGRVVLHLNASNLKDGNSKDNCPVELVMSNKQFVSMVNCAMKKEDQTPSFPKNMTKEYAAAMSRIYPKATEQEHLQRYQVIRDAMNKGAQSLVQESTVQRVQPNRNRGTGMER